MAPTRWRTTGRPRFTGDLDVLVRPTLANGQRVLEAIAAFGFPTAALTPADIASEHKVIEMGVVPVQLHVMRHIDSVSWDDVWATREMGALGRHEVAFIGRQAFLRNKQRGARPRASSRGWES